ncbi:6-hydroxy-D-nicotine oxidase [Fusarium heterosporum]|uniref:6-hydroxy-D-nicotine oxidase n=1 Tax=Fusarium heterosporum TaxID=42747 RepID=A0A8H5U2F3_FUSHE|nr:6-hydroxy-D-nicotine oxidase [Fusarium heterosporum]
MQMQVVPRRRAPRQTSSCLECRRRKQKCSQGQPCTNCYRRFPQPDCVYEVKSSNRIVPITPCLPEPSNVEVREGPYSHLDPSLVNEVLHYLEEEPSDSLSEADSSLLISPSPSRPRTSIWRPYSAIPSEHGNSDDDNISQTVQIITAHGIKEAKRFYAEEQAAVQKSKSNGGHRLTASPIGHSTTHLQYLPMRQTKLNKELVRIHGNPDPTNEFMKSWIPCTVQDPLLLQIVLFTSSCFLSETGHMSKSLQNIHKSRVFWMLNSQLKDITDKKAPMTDNLILGVVQMIADSWYWGGTDDLQYHLRGLKVMLITRGGLSKLGLRGHLAKMILIHDIGIALAHEIKPSIYGHPSFKFHDPRAMPFKTAFNSPLICNWQSFGDCANSLQLHPSTAQILDDMRSLFAAVLTLPKAPTLEQTQRVMDTANCVHGRILSLPERTPPPRPFNSSRSNSSRSSPANSPESTGSEKSEDLPDIMYEIVRKVALIYCQAILSRSPISSTCSEQDIGYIWGSIWKSGLPTWKSVLGVFVWIMIALASNCHKIGPGRLIKTMTISTMMSIGMEDWHTFTQISLNFHGKMYNLARLRESTKYGEVLLPGDAGYEEKLQRWSTACVKRAAAVIIPLNSQEVSHAIKFAVSNKIALTVCGGGHSSSGASSTEGIVIDLRKMRRVAVDTEALSVEYEGGCIWEDVDAALERYGLATVGGVVNHTGVGGLTLGGGHGFLTPRHGLTIDNLLKAEVVLANGEVVEASEDVNQDLFWAIRGAGAQFGVVTRFVSRAHEQSKVWSGPLAYSADKLPSLLEFANGVFGRSNPEGHCVTLGIGYGPDGKTRIVSIIPLFHGPEADARQFFSSLLELESIADDTEMMTTAKTNTLLNSVMDHGIRRLMGSGNITMPLDIEPMLETADMFWKFCDDHEGMGKSVLAIEYFSTEKIREVDQGATAYANRGDYYDALTSFGWEDPNYDDDVRQFNRSICKRIRETNGHQKVAGSHWSQGPVGVYINIEADSISPADAWGTNLPRLRELKKRYDPQNVFNKWHGIGEDPIEVAP